MTPTKREHSQRHDRAATRMFLGLFGRNRNPATLSQRDWDRFIRERRAGRIGPSGRPVSDRTIQCNLKFLIAVLNWAAKSRDEQGCLLLDSNPLKGLRTPTEKNPTRVVLAQREYPALLRVSRQVDWKFRVALVLAHETGHRIGAIRQLCWSGTDFEGGTILWRAEQDKPAYEHITPVTAEAIAALSEARRPIPLAGETPLLPAPGIPRPAWEPRWHRDGGTGPRGLRVRTQARRGLALLLPGCQNAGPNVKQRGLQMALEPYLRSSAQAFSFRVAWLHRNRAPRWGLLKQLKGQTSSRVGARLAVEHDVRGNLDRVDRSCGCLSRRLDGGGARSTEATETTTGARWEPTTSLPKADADQCCNSDRIIACTRRTSLRCDG